jgi:hypothetical protein
MDILYLLFVAYLVSILLGTFTLYVGYTMIYLLCLLCEDSRGNVHT